MTIPVEIQEWANILISAGITLIAPAVTAWLVAKIIEVVTTSRQYAGEAKFDLMVIIAKRVVAAAHQAGVGSLIANVGTEKKAYALTAAKALLAQAGLKNVNVDAISALIEAEYLAFKKALEGANVLAG